MMGDERDDDLHPEGAQAEAFSLLATALPPRAPSVAKRDQLLAALRSALARIADPSAWQPGFWPDSELLQTPELARSSTLIARLAPGSVIAQHQHPFRELTYVLDGALTEDDERRVGPGGLLDAQPGSTHAIAVSGASPCLVVFAIRRD
jgi:quercetin dioxygenase-like cupin family protein